LLVAPGGVLQQHDLHCREHRHAACRVVRLAFADEDPVGVEVDVALIQIADLLLAECGTTREGVDGELVAFLREAREHLILRRLEERAVLSLVRRAALPLARIFVQRADEHEKVEVDLRGVVASAQRV
jgi:hypothetical protein